MGEDSPARRTLKHFPNKSALPQKRRPVKKQGEITYCEVRIEKDKCKGCRLCIINCPSKHLELSVSFNKRGIPYVKIKKGTKCTGCGFCFFVCPETCIEVYEK